MKKNNGSVFLAETSTQKLLSSKKNFKKEKVDAANSMRKNIHINFCSIWFYFLQHISLLPSLYVS